MSSSPTASRTGPGMDALRSRSGVLDLADLPWHRVRERPLSPPGLFALRYMQEIESYTTVYLRALLSTRAAADPEVAPFLARWYLEETAHGLALARFLEACGEPLRPVRPGRTSLRTRLHGAAACALSTLWRDFPAVHMTWGAINELTTLTGYRCLARVERIERHPLLGELLDRIVRDESRHFRFYFTQARRRLGRASTRRRVRALVERFWAPVGSGERPAAHVRAVAAHLFAGARGRAAARKVDATIRALPGLEGIPLLEAWLEGAGVQ